MQELSLPLASGAGMIPTRCSVSFSLFLVEVLWRVEREFPQLQCKGKKWLKNMKERSVGGCKKEEGGM